MSERARPRTVVDTNLFVSGVILSRGVPFRLLEAIRSGRVALITSDELRAEVADVLSRPALMHRYRLTHERVAALLALIDAVATFVSPIQSLPVQVRDVSGEK